MYNIWDFNPIDGPHIVQMSFQLPYLDWCRFERSKLFHDLTEYLVGLGKQEETK